MAINFPANPSNGDVHAGFTYNSTKSVWEANSPSMMATSDTAPTSPSDGQMWFDTDGGGTFLYYEDADSSQWVEVIGSQGSPGADGADGGAGVASVYATVNDLPTSGNSQGDMAHVTANNTLYFWNGSGWYKIALINTNPSISGVSSSYALATDGTATVVTVTASDPEGLPITYSIASDTSGNIATVTQGTGASSNVFTVTPSTSQANAGSFTLTFRASDSVNLATAPASFTLQFSVENSNYTTALITSVGANNAVNNFFVDSSSSNLTLTAASGVQNTFSPYRHGGYSAFFGTGVEYLSVAPDASFTFGTGDFTIEGWAYLLATGDRGFFQQATSLFPTSSVNSLAVQTVASGTKWAIYAGNTQHIAATATYSLNQWYHWAMVRESSVTKLYIDGVEVISISDTTNYTGTYFGIGQLYGTGVGNNLNGYLTDVRVIKGTALYTSAFTPPTERLTAVANTSLLTCHLPYFVDGSTNGHTITNTGVTTQPFAPYDYQEYSSSSHGGSIYSNGAHALTIPSDLGLRPGTGDFTLEFWWYPTSSSNSQYIYSQDYNNGNNGYANFLVYATTTNVVFYSTTTGSSWNIHNAVNIGAYSVNQWHHIAVSRESGTIRFFLNGVEGSSAANTADYSNTGSTRLGTYDGTNGGYYGSISDVRFVNGNALYTGAFTPPTAPLTNITNTALLINGTNAGIIDKSQSSSQLILDGDSKCSSTQTKYRSTAIYTDGTGDRVRFGINNKKLVCDWGVGGEPFTVEWWMYDTQPYTAQHSFGPQTGGGAGAWNSSTGHQWITYWNSNVLNIYYYGTNGSYNGNTCTAAQLGIVQNQWQHVAHTYDGTTWRLYVDGVHGFHWVLPNQPASVSGTFAAIGAFAESAYYTAAYYDDVRITKGLARYTGTSSFTPPTAALQG